MLADFTTHITINFPDLLEAPVLLACSGGVDSMVLTHLCHNSGINITLAHCNFRLRGKQSDEDENSVAKFAKQLGIPYLVTHFDTLGYVNQHKVSVQMAARDLRYAWFSQLMQTKNFTKTLTAHHLDDALETFIINLSRGSGLEGLTGIPEHTATVARPLLKYSRAAIEQYAQDNELSWREDPSNHDEKYLRSSIRGNIVPLLKELHPSFLENFKHSIGYLSQSNQIAKQRINLVKKALFSYEKQVIKIPICSLQELEPLEGYLYGLFSTYGFTAWQNIRDLLTAMSGKQIYSKTHSLLKDREHLLLSAYKPDMDKQIASYKILEDTKYCSIPLELSFTTVTERKENSADIIYVAKNALKYPLTVRKWKNGDYFYPLGLGGKKKLAKFFKDEKIPVAFKEKQWLLCAGEKIVWVIGKRADERFKVQPSTTAILRIEVSL